MVLMLRKKQNKILKNFKLLIDNYNSELNRLLAIPSNESGDYLNREENFITWSAKLEDSIKKSKIFEFDET